MDDFKDWAQDVFGDAELGDVRRTTRLVCMAAKAVRQPSGRLSVHGDPKIRKGTCLKLCVTYLEGKPHLPLVELRRAA